MDIFDLSIEEFEKQIDNLLNSISEDELLIELTDNGLKIDEYENDSLYEIEDNIENTWVHIESTSTLKRLISLMSKKSTSNLTEAA